MAESKTTTAESESETPNDLKALLYEAEQALSSLVDDADDTFDDLRDRLRAALSDDKNLLRRLRERAALRAKQADTLVRENPYYAIGVAAGIGALIGIAASRCCSR